MIMISTLQTCNAWKLRVALSNIKIRIIGFPESFWDLGISPLLEYWQKSLLKTKAREATFQAILYLNDDS